jgi:hypothetical protein
MLYSSSDDDWKKERTWIIKFLADGMVGSEDWKVLKRRHTWDLLASLFQSESSMGSAGLRAGIFEVSSFNGTAHESFCNNFLFYRYWRISLAMRKQPHRSS